MLEADYQTWMPTLLVPFMPVITLFLVSFVMLGDLPWDDDDDDDDRDGGILIPAYVPSGA